MDCGCAAFSFLFHKTRRYNLHLIRDEDIKSRPDYHTQSEFCLQLLFGQIYSVKPNPKVLGTQLCGTVKFIHWSFQNLCVWWTNVADKLTANTPASQNLLAWTSRNSFQASYSLGTGLFTPPLAFCGHDCAPFFSKEFKKRGKDSLSLASVC